MTFLYTARGAYDSKNNEGKLSWKKYLERSKLVHLEELVSLDGMLNENLVEPDYDNADDWNCTHIVDKCPTDFFTTLNFVMKRMKITEKFNLLKVVVEPKEDCEKIDLDGYEFVGYDLLDQDFNVSAITNCGGFNEIFSPKDLNTRGLIDDFHKAYDIQKWLLQNNPEEHHAHTNVIAVWRHKTIGR